MSEPAPRAVPAPSVDSAAQFDPADRVTSGSVLPNRPGAATDRYGAPMKQFQGKPEVTAL